MPEGIPECIDCWDGKDLKPGEKCLVCGRVGAVESGAEPGWEKKVYSQLSSSEFQERVILARRALGLPDGGLSRDEAISRLLGAHIAAAITYGWSLERFQRIFLPLDEKARTVRLQSLFGKEWAKFIASYTMPNPNRASDVEWLLVGKLVAARLCSLLGESNKVAIDNVSDMFLYIVCPKLRPFDSWKLRPANTGQEPWQRQFDSFLQAVPLLPDESKGKRQSRALAAAALKLTFDFLEGKVSFDKCRRAYVAACPFPIPEEAEPTSAIKMRAYRAIGKLPYQRILRVVRSLFGR